MAKMSELDADRQRIERLTDVVLPPTFAQTKNAGPDYLKARGVVRDVGKTLLVYFNRRPTDDELRAVHDCLRKVPATCPFCAKPTYVLPCSHCDEPDVPEDF